MSNNTGPLLFTNKLFLSINGWNRGVLVDRRVRVVQLKEGLEI